MGWERLKVHMERNIYLYAQEQLAFFEMRTGIKGRVSITTALEIPEDAEREQLELPFVGEGTD